MVLQDLLSDLFLLYSMVSNLLSVFIFLMDLLLLQAKESHKEKRKRKAMVVLRMGNAFNRDTGDVDTELFGLYIPSIR